MHNTAFAAAKLDLHYSACTVSPEALGDAVRGLRALNFAGANVTIPHKRAVVPYLDETTGVVASLSFLHTPIPPSDGGSVSSQTRFQKRRMK